MGTNVNQQIVSVNFFDPADSQIVNRLLKGFIKPGIYSGGWLSGSGTTAYVSAFLALMHDSQTPPLFDYSLRAESTIGISSDVGSTALTVANGNYVVIRWGYTQSNSTNYVSLVATNSPTVDDLIVGQCVITGGNLTFNYAQRSQAADSRLDFFVQAETDPASGYVWVNSGPWVISRIATQRVQVTNGTNTAGATYYIYLDTLGAAHVSQVPVAGVTVVASVYFISANMGAVTQSMVTDLRQTVSRSGPYWLPAPVQVPGFPQHIAASGYYNNPTGAGWYSYGGGVYFAPPPASGWTTVGPFAGVPLGARALLVTCRGECNQGVMSFYGRITGLTGQGVLLAYVDGSAASNGAAGDGNTTECPCDASGTFQYALTGTLQGGYGGANLDMLVSGYVL